METVTTTVIKKPKYGPYAAGYSPYPNNKKVIIKKNAGYERISGFYGRYNKGPSSELKFFDTTLSFLIDATGEVPATGQLALIPQGVTESTRVGRKANVKSINVKGNVTFVPVAYTDAAVCTVYVVQDKQCNGAAAAVTDVYTSSNLSIGMINMANSERFRILKKFTWTVKPEMWDGTSMGIGYTVLPFEWYSKCDIPLEFSSTTGAITEIKSNNIFLLASCQNGLVPVDDKASVSGTCRLRFGDS